MKVEAKEGEVNQFLSKALVHSEPLGMLQNSQQFM